MAEINVVPYIDVMLVLLVIFIVTAPLLSQGVHVELPRTASEPIVPEDGREPIVLTVDAKGRYYMNYGENQEAPVAPRELLRNAKALLKYSPDTRFYVKADRDTRYEEVVRLLALLRDADIKGVGLMTKPPPDRG